MQIGKVIGNVWATRKEEGLQGLKLLIVQPVDVQGKPVKTQFVAADRIGAGIGDDVLVTSGGSSRYIMRDHPMPIDAVIIGIIDSTEVERGEIDEQSNRDD
ncbi:EutN/CcmL family microcompartment protein [Psychrobacillus sp. L4]|uniref:EutN/CcmL family microcompartment protein n=1 Tax=Psychrobacillus sp. L4 TaxID=3236892 RepID=UPI0036F2B5D5